MPEGMKLATAYYELTPSMRGNEGQITKQFDGIGKNASTAFAGSFGGNLKRELGRMRGPLIAAGASVIAGLGIKKVVTGTTDAFKDLTLEVIQFQRITGDSVKNASRLRFAVEDSGVEVKRAATSFGIFSKNLAAAQGNTKKTAVLNKLLGTSFTDAHGKLLPLTVLLPKVSDTFAKMPAGPAKTAAAMKLFGRSGRDLLPFLNKGSAGIAEMTKKSDELGLTLGDDAVKKFSDYRQASRDFDATLMGLKVTIGSALLPVLTDLSVGLTHEITPAIQNLRRWVDTDGEAAAKHLSKFINDDAIPAVDSFAQSVGPLAKSTLPALGTGLKVAADAVKVMAPPLNSIVKSFNSLPKFAQTAIILGAGTAAVGRKAGLTLGASRGAKAAGKSALSKEAGAASRGGFDPRLAIALFGGVVAIETSKQVANRLTNDLPKFAPGGPIGGGTSTATAAQLRATEAARERAFKAMGASGKNPVGFDETKSADNLRRSFDLAANSGNILGKQIDTLGTKKADPKVTTGGLTGALSGLASLGDRLDAVSKKHARPTVTIGGIGGALNYLQSLGSAIDRLARKQAKGGGKGYAGGTNYATPGWHPVGEDGMELIKFRGGEQVVPNRKAMQMVSGSSSSSATGQYMRLHPADLQVLGTIVSNNITAGAGLVVNGHAELAATTGRQRR